MTSAGRSAAFFEGVDSQCSGSCIHIEIDHPSVKLFIHARAVSALRGLARGGGASWQATIRGDRSMPADIEKHSFARVGVGAARLLLESLEAEPAKHRLASGAQCAAILALLRQRQ